MMNSFVVCVWRMSVRGLLLAPVWAFRRHVTGAGFGRSEAY